jgi:mannosyltransferase OCH1-like enzyme
LPFNPGRLVVVVSDESFKKYISMSDLPSTFRCLIAQQPSDLIHIAVLLCYGGAYLDIFNIILKEFNDTRP